jgi:Carboxypeptidase regulatory-like domain
MDGRRTSCVWSTLMLVTMLCSACTGNGTTSPTPESVTQSPTPTPMPAPAAPAKYTVAGLLTDGTSGGILPGINIQLLDGQNSGQSTRTDSIGRYSLANVLAGTMTLSAAATSYQTVTRSIAVSGDTTVNIVLLRASTPTPTPAPTPTPTPTPSPTGQPANQCIAFQPFSSGGYYLAVNSCNVKVFVAWIDQGSCRTDSRGYATCAAAPDANSRELVTGIQGSYKFAACVFPSGPVDQGANNWSGGPFVCR